MHILVSSDNKYIQHLGVMLISLLENCKTSNLKEIAVINDNIDPANINKLITSLKQYDVSVRLIEFNNTELAHIAPKNNKTLAAYHRIFIEEFYSKEVEKVLYLDCDMIVRKDISILFNTDISSFVIGAVQNDGINYQEKLGMPVEKMFFNSGVMLINLPKWRETNVKQRALNFINANFDSMVRNDQDALNAILFDQWYSLNPSWNAHVYFFTSPHLCRYDQDNLRAILKDPAIVHFTAFGKPWFYMSTHPFKHEYYKYLKLSSWCDYIPPDKTISNRIKKLSLALSGSLKGKKRLIRKTIKRIIRKT